MSIQLSEAARNARLDAIETVLGTLPYLDLRTGALPPSCADADTGTELLHAALPSDWMSAASGGTKSKSGVWSASATGVGTAGHFRMKDSGDLTCHIQGSVTGTGGGGDMELNNVSLAATQVVTVDTFVLTDGNA